jgi:hypothetical protein
MSKRLKYTQYLLRIVNPVKITKFPNRINVEYFKIFATPVMDCESCPNNQISDSNKCRIFLNIPITCLRSIVNSTQSHMDFYVFHSILNVMMFVKIN